MGRTEGPDSTGHRGQLARAGGDPYSGWVVVRPTIALYLPQLRPAVLDRARALLEALGRAATVVSPHAAPPYARSRWVRLPDGEPSTWRDWVRTHRPRLVIVDGSGSHARAVTGMGATVGLVAQVDGEMDPELGAAYSEVDLVLAPWAPGDHAEESWPTRWQERTLHLGALGWQATTSARRRSRIGAGVAHRAHCVVLTGTSAGPGPRDRRAMMTGTPGWLWTYLPEQAIFDDGYAWDALWASSAVVCAPTAANLAAVAAARKPAMLVVANRSQGQAFLADRARTSAPVLVRDSWPGTAEWEQLLDDVRRLDGEAWRAWSPEPGLARLAAIAGTGLPTEPPMTDVVPSHESVHARV